MGAERDKRDVALIKGGLEPLAVLLAREATDAEQTFGRRVNCPVGARKGNAA